MVNWSIEISDSFPPSPDANIVLITVDHTAFYVDLKLLYTVSQNAFGQLLLLLPGLQLETPMLFVDQPARVLDIVLCAMYARPAATYTPDLDDISAAVDALLVLYAVPAAFVLGPESPLFSLILRHANNCPLQVYTLAAKHGLEQLAVTASPHTLVLPLSSLSDEDADRMGPVYLRRLFFLHLGRVDALKRLLSQPPAGHKPTSYCREEGQESLRNSWVLVAGFLNMQAKCVHLASCLLSIY